MNRSNRIVEGVAKFKLFFDPTKSDRLPNVLAIAETRATESWSHYERR